jgi:thiamine biosynthesis lipoprotein
VTAVPASGLVRTASHRLAVEAMATRFELIVEGDDPAALHAAGEEALAVITRIESRLSAFQPLSDIAWINGRAGQRAVKVEPRLFALLQRCVALSAATDGAFDITVGPLMRAWHLSGGATQEAAGAPDLPSTEAVAEARSRVGSEHLHFDPHASTIRFARPGMRIDLGAAGKGYAIDEAIASLRANGVPGALLHGGTSSVHVLGRPIDGEVWKVAWNPPGGRGRLFPLHDGALSVSAAHGKAFTRNGRQYGHVIDPSTGWPADGVASAVVTGPGSLECDALSTALLVLGADWLPTLRARFPGYDGAVAATAAASDPNGSADR